MLLEGLSPFTFILFQATQLDLHRHFYALGAGVIEEVRVQRDKGFGFIRYSTHDEAALAIQMGNAQSILCGRQIKVNSILPDGSFFQYCSCFEVHVILDY